MSKKLSLTLNLVKGDTETAITDWAGGLHTRTVSLIGSHQRNSLTLHCSTSLSCDNDGTLLPRSIKFLLKYSHLSGSIQLNSLQHLSLGPPVLCQTDKIRSGLRKVNLQDEHNYLTNTIIY